MKYYKLSKDGEDLNVILACENEEFERKAFEKYGKDYTLTECECPKDAHFVNEEPTLGRATPYMMQNYRELERMAGGFANEKHTIYDGPNCGRCANRFRHSAWCSQHYLSTKNCYRFKLEH